MDELEELLTPAEDVLLLPDDAGARKVDAFAVVLPDVTEGVLEVPAVDPDILEELGELELPVEGVILTVLLEDEILVDVPVVPLETEFPAGVLVVPAVPLVTSDDERDEVVGEVFLATWVALDLLDVIFVEVLPVEAVLLVLMPVALPLTPELLVLMPELRPTPDVREKPRPPVVRAREPK